MSRRNAPGVKAACGAHHAAIGNDGRFYIIAGRGLPNAYFSRAAYGTNESGDSVSYTIDAKPKE